MKRDAKYYFAFLLFFVCSLVSAQTAVDTIEAFENGIELFSYGTEDYEPTAWELNAAITHENSAYSLKLFGNTWKTENIIPRRIDTATVWRISVYSEEVAEIQGFGISDGTNTLFYSLFGTEEVEFENWETVYQGAFPPLHWNDFLLPVGKDWLSQFGDLPNVTQLVFVNDMDETFEGSVYFDDITDVTNLISKAPVVSVNYTSGKIYSSGNEKFVNVHFYSEVYDPDSDEWQYLWDFGDGAISEEADPTHTFVVTDNHEYTVILQVLDEQNNYGFASCKVNVDEGESSLPLTINFAGDVMLARGMSEIIDYYGIEAVFQPTLQYFGNDADISVANLECALTNAVTHHPTKPIFFKGKPEYVYGLNYAGIDAVTLANNHIYDYLDDGLTETVETLDANGVVNFGAGINSYFAKKPAFVSRKGLAVALLGASDRTGQYNNYQPYLNAGFNKAGFAELTEFNIAEQIESARNSDLIIFQMHSGREYSTAPHKIDALDGDEFYDENYCKPAKSDIAIRRFAIDSGADAVICHHPHIAQGFEVYKGKLIAHSLGNFVFDMGYAETFWSVILKGFADENGFYKYEITPVYIRDFIPRRARGETGLYWLNALADMSRELNAYLVIDKDSVKAEIVLDSTSLQFEKISVEETLAFTGENGSYYSKPLKIRKNGSLSKIISVGRNGNFEFRLGREKLWYGNMEDECAQPWEFNHPDEFYDNDEYYEGARSLCQKRPANRLPLNTYLLKRIKIYNPEREFTLHAFIKTENAKNAGVQILIYDSRYSDYPLAVYELNDEVSGTNDWTECFGDFEIPEYGKYFNIRLRSESPNAGTGKSWFDDVGVIEWSDWKSGNVEIDFPNDYYWVQIRKSAAASEETIVYEETILNAEPVGTYEDDETTEPKGFRLLQNYPNPFNPTTTISYSLPATNGAESFRGGRTVSLQVFNSLGQKITTLVNRKQTPGFYSVQFDASGLSSGVYFYRLRYGEFVSVKKMVLLK